MHLKLPRQLAGSIKLPAIHIRHDNLLWIQPPLIIRAGILWSAKYPVAFSNTHIPAGGVGQKTIISQTRDITNMLSWVFIHGRYTQFEKVIQCVDYDRR